MSDMICAKGLFKRKRNIGAAYQSNLWQIKCHIRAFSNVRVRVNNIVQEIDEQRSFRVMAGDDLP